jgi:L-iditol 2-dehydrogenase
MKRANLVQPRRMVIEQVPIPEPAPGEVRIDVRECGVCGSDIHAYLGKHPMISCPIVPGHEFSGVVDALGAGVGGLRVGMPVVVEPSLTCGKCEPCRTGRYNICDNLRVLGCQATGAQADYITVPAAKVIPMCEGMSFEQGALIEPTAVAVHALRRVPIHLADRVLIAGAGTIGLQVLQVARALGASATIVTDVVEQKLAFARQLGATYTVNSRTQSLSDFLRTQFGQSNAVDVALECVGVDETMSQCVEACKKGGQIVVVGVFAHDAPVRLSWVQDRELELIGTLMYMRRDFEKARDLIASGQVQTEPLITRRAPLDDLPQVMEAILADPTANVKSLIHIH